MSETIGRNLGNARLRELTPEQKFDKDQLIRFTGRTLRLGVNKGEEFRGYLEDIAVKVRPTDFFLYEVGNLIGGPFLSVDQTRLALEVFRGYLPSKKYSEAEEYINNALVRRGERVIKLPPMPQTPDVPAVPVSSPVVVRVVEPMPPAEPEQVAEPAFTEALAEAKLFNAKHTQVEVSNNPDLQEQELRLWDEVNRLIYVAELRDINPSVLSELSDSARYTVLSIVRDEGEEASAEWRVALQDEQERNHKINNIFLNRYSQMRLLDCANRLQQILPVDPFETISVPSLEAERNRLLRVVSLITNRGIDSHTLGRTMAKYPQNVRVAVGSTIIASNLAIRYSEAIQEDEQGHGRNPQGTVRDNLVYIAGVYGSAGSFENLMRGDYGTAGLRNGIADMRKEIQFLMPQIDPAELGRLVASIDNEAARQDASILYRGLGLDEQQYQLFQQSLINELREKPKLVLDYDKMSGDRLVSIADERYRKIKKDSLYEEKRKLWDLLQIAKGKDLQAWDADRIKNLEYDLELYHHFMIPGKDYYYQAERNSVEAKIKELEEKGIKDIPLDAREFKIGEKVYVTIGKLGGGYFATVYAAKSATGEYAAIKLAKGDLDLYRIKDFEGEIRILQYLQSTQVHLNLLVNGHFLTPEVLGRGQTNTGRSFFATSLATGVETPEIIVRQRLWGGSILRKGEAATIISQFCRVLQILHEGLDQSYHDFQPKNIFWDRKKGAVTVVDFNVLAPFMDTNGDWVGKNVQADLLATSQLLYGLSSPTGSYSDEKSLADLLIHIEDPQLRTVLERGLNPDASKRFQSAREMREALEALVTTTATE